MHSVQDDWPTWALLPKRETNVSSFLAKYPEYDGRGIKIAIFDSGIDPSAPGLQKTSDGKVKIIEMMDGSGAGDVDTSTVVEAVDNEITGLSGKKLKIPASWNNPSKKYHIGLKNGYELFTKSLKERIIKDEKEKKWDPLHKILTAESIRKLQEFNNQHTNNPLPFPKKMEKEELEATSDILNSLEKKYNDLGPVYDCVVFNDGEVWRAVLDTSLTGDLESCKLLGSYSSTHEYTTLSSTDMLNYVVNVYDDGNILEVVTMSSPHGTHVASIAAANFPDCPEKNGVAPGAQIVSVCIGDSRLSSMETGSAIIRALIKVINSHVDVINMSYGEAGHWVGGRVLDLVHEVVNKHGVIMIVSAGNMGPALTTVGTPPVMPSSSIMGIGAYVSPDMMSVEYSLREKMPGLDYTWTSRGPGANGDLVVSVCAPGSAITTVPKYLLRGCQLMNGTSMAAPHATGCVANLLSALQRKNIPYSPYSVRRAIENTALKVHSYDVFSMGHGLIQIDKAFEHLENFSNSDDRNIRINININNKKGIYLRESFKINRPHTAVVTVEPFFLDAQNTDHEKKIAFNMNLTLVCDVPWVSIPTHLNLMYTSRSFTIRIDPRGLPHGVHFTWIKAYECNVSKGPIFEIPVTVIKPMTIDESSNYDVRFPSIVMQPGKVARHFFDVPCGTTYATFWMRSQDMHNDASFVIHAVQVRPQYSFRHNEFHKMVRLGPKEEMTLTFPLEENRVLEVAVAKWWANQDIITLDYCISFHSLKPNIPRITMHAADGFHRVDIHSSLRQEELLPSISLKQHVIPIRPVENKITPLKLRDVIPDGRQIYEIQLTYNFSLSKAVEISPFCAVLSDVLYESEYESQLWQIFDCNKQFLFAGDAYPAKFQYLAKLDKGDYVMKRQIRHENRSLLEKLTEMPMLLQLKLSSSINLDIYDKQSSALISGKKISWCQLSAGIVTPIFISPISADKLPKGSSPGHYLSGTITLSKDEAVKKAVSYPVKYIITEFPSKKASKEKEKDKEKTVEEEYLEAARDLKINWIPKVDQKLSKELFEEVMAKDPNHIPAMLNRLQFLEDCLKSPEKHKEKSPKPTTKQPATATTSDNDAQKKKNDIIVNSCEAIELANKILSSINLVEVLAFIGSKGDKKENPNSKQLEKQKFAIIESLCKKGSALCNLALNGISDISNISEIKSKFKTCENEVKPATTDDQLGAGDGKAECKIEDKSDGTKVTALSQANEVYKELQKWIDMSDSKVAVFVENHALAHQHYGRLLKLYLRQLEEKSVIDLDKKCIEIYKKLQWMHCANFFEKSLCVKYPPNYRLF